MPRAQLSLIEFPADDPEPAAAVLGGPAGGAAGRSRRARGHRASDTERRAGCRGTRARARTRGRGIAAVFRRWGHGGGARPCSGPRRQCGASWWGVVGVPGLRGHAVRPRRRGSTRLRPLRPNPPLLRSGAPVVPTVWAWRRETKSGCGEQPWGALLVGGGPVAECEPGQADVAPRPTQAPARWTLPPARCGVRQQHRRSQADERWHRERDKLGTWLESWPGIRRRAPQWPSRATRSPGRPSPAARTASIDTCR